jgi:N-acetylmuramoyl-L-alanine amidase
VFLTLKKKTVIIIVAAVLCAASFFAAIGFASAKADSGRANGMVVVVDAGHGGIDGGVVGSATGVKESDINLAVARSLKHFLTSKGYQVVMTRNTTDGLYGMSTKNRKIRDMEARRKIIVDAKPDMVVSIHQNSYPRAAQSGAQVFYALNSEPGRAAAETVQSVVNANLDSGRAAAAGDYYILRCSEYTSLIVECGFLTNPVEERLLISAPYQEKVAYTIFTGIHTVLSGR